MHSTRIGANQFQQTRSRLQPIGTHSWIKAPDSLEQDYLRWILLREHDRAGAPNIGLVDQTARYALDHGYHVILEGILSSSLDETVERVIGDLAWTTGGAIAHALED